MSTTIAIGADIGGSHISAAAIDLATGKVLEDTAAERKLDNHAPAAEIIGVWASCVKDALAKVPGGTVKGIGFAMPGPFDYVNGIAQFEGVAKYEKLHGVNVGKALREVLHTDLRFMNDASCFAVGEARAGKAASSRKSMSITLGTGLGSACIEDGVPIVDGPTVPPLGFLNQIPYRDSVADAHFSTRGLVERYRQATGLPFAGVKEIMAAREPVAKAPFEAFGEDLAGFLAPWLSKFGAEVLVIGGNISFAWDFFGSAFEDRLAKDGCACRVQLSELKEDAALLGAALLFDDAFWKSVQHALPLMSHTAE